MVMYVFFDGGGKLEKYDILVFEMQCVQEMYNVLVEVVVENDEGLMECFFDEGIFIEEELMEGFWIVIVYQDIFLVFISFVICNMGSGCIMGFINDVCFFFVDCLDVWLVGIDEKLACDSDVEIMVFVYKMMMEL